MTHKLLTFKRLGFMAAVIAVFSIVATSYILEQSNPIEPTINSKAELSTNGATELAVKSAIEKETKSTIELATNSTIETEAGSAIETTTNDTMATAAYSAIESVTSDASIVSPLSHLLGIELSDESNFENNERIAQESIKECMSGKGFEYIPMSQMSPSDSKHTSSADEGSLAYANEHGYGITEALEQEMNTFVNGESFFNDPNEEIRVSLSVSDAQAYDAALTGFSTNQVKWRESDGAPINSLTGQVLSKSEFEELSKSGCLHKAYAPENEHHTHLVSKLLVSDEYLNVQLQIQNDSRMIDLQVDWSSCMAAKGYDYGSPKKLRDSLYEQGISIVQKQAGGNGDLSDSDIAKLLYSHKLKELELAVADWACSDEFFKNAPIITREHEVNFIEENKDLILDILHTKKI